MLPLFLLFVPALLLAGECQPSPELKKWREANEKASKAERRKSLDELAAKYPNDYEIQVQRISFYRWSERASFPAVREQYARRAEATPDPLSLTLAASALHRHDTPRAIALLTKAGDYPWAALKLTEIHASGKFEDKAKARDRFDVYAKACGEYFTRQADWLMGKIAGPETQSLVAKRLRSRLEGDKAADPYEWELLWGLEFRSTPPAQHPELRKRVAADVERLLASNPGKKTLPVLRGGIKQSGASPEVIKEVEDRIVREAGTTYTAYSITYDRWIKEHKMPEDHKDTAAWDAWRKALRPALEDWASRFTDVASVSDWLVNLQLETGELDEKQGIAAIEKALNKEVAKNGPYIWTYANHAGRLNKRGWAPAKASEWMEKAWPLAEEEDKANLDDDTLSDERRKELTEGMGYRGYLVSDYLRAVKLAGKKTVPTSLRAYLDGPMPGKKENWSSRYQSLAWLAMIDGRDADALTYFQQALFTRDKAPKHFQGKFEDRLLDEAKSAFLKTGGSEKTFALWSKPAGEKKELAEGRWEKPKKALPAFELADVSGKNWKLTQFEGKSVLINLWATWCGPCRQELPHFQKLYEKTKDRPDVQVISFNIDDELGLVEPYMKENGYTFPALAAYGLIQQIYNDGWAIPQNWLIDARGNWIATQIGFDSSDTDWEASMLKRLEAAKQGKAPAGVE